MTAEWFRDQLQTTADSFVWAVEQVPPERRSVRPPYRLGEWPAARHAHHLLFYEARVAVPSLVVWLGGPGPDVRRLNEERAWASGPALDSVLRQFRDTRADQIAPLSEFGASAWDEERATVWGKRTLRWVVTKTLQHTAEHTHGVLSLALYWDL